VKTRRIVAIGLLLAGGVALLALQRRLVTTEITPRPLLYLVADTEREAERIPLALTRVSGREENQIGQELARSYGLTPAVHKDADAQRIAAYVQEVGKRLTANVKRKEIQYRFFYKDEPDFVNAGALPGGQIVIGRGLLELLESEDELAAILGHEVAHVDERHAIERLQYEVQSRKIGMRGLYRLGQIGVVLFQMGYTKEKEDEADRVGLGLTVRAGYSPAGAVEVMKRFDRLFGGQARTATSPVEELAGMPLRSLREYFRSHPPARERIATLEKEIRARGYNAAQALKPLGVRAIFLTEQAKVLDQHGMFDRAIARYQDALKADHDYWPAWEGLANSTWRAGNASGTIEPSMNGLKVKWESYTLWELLADALGAEYQETGAERFSEFFESLRERMTPQLQRNANVKLCGLKIIGAGKRAEGMKEFRAVVAFGLGLSPREEAFLRRKMGLQMYRRGMLREAFEELEAARQLFPQERGVDLTQVWVLTDLGRQADALAILNQITNPVAPDELHAVRALIDWRTDRKDEAKGEFRQAAEQDPVWMVPKWVANNCSADAAAVIAKLQAEEMARRKKVEAIRTAAGKR